MAIISGLYGTRGTKILCKCNTCGKDFKLDGKYRKRILESFGRVTGDFCSRFCANSIKNLSKTLPCKNCEKPCTRRPSELKKNKNVFCSHECSGIYGAKNKTTGSKRSKLERWVESQLTSIYPDIAFAFNDITAIKAELDIYIPQLSLAFELNGIFHYENIFGKLEKTQNRDKMKVTLCSESGISLCVIDTRKHCYFKEKFALEVLKIIQDIVDERVAAISSV